MTKTKLTLVIALVALLLPATALAVSDNAQSGQSSNSSAVSSQSETQVQTETQTQAQTNNPGTGTVTQAEAQVRLNEQIAESKPAYNAKNANMAQSQSKVATAAENLVRVASTISNTASATQLRTIAKTMTENQDKIGQSIDKADVRTSFAKFFIGPNYKELGNTNQVMEQNRLQIQDLEQLMANLSTDSEKLQVSDQIRTLLSQQLELRDQVKDHLSYFSLFGWIYRFAYGF